MPLEATDQWRQVLCPNDATTQKITEIQKALMAAGVGPRKTTGKLDAETIKALKAYQQAKALPVDGRLNADTVKSLSVSMH
jgi:peptidoglycan hydrolase-like protein with peptidoglycan-binding domain